MFCSAFQSVTCYCGSAETQQKFLSVWEKQEEGTKRATEGVRREENR